MQPHLFYLMPDSAGTHMQKVSDVTQFHGQELSSAHPVQRSLDGLSCRGELRR